MGGGVGTIEVVGGMEGCLAVRLTMASVEWLRMREDMRSRRHCYGDHFYCCTGLANRYHQNRS